MISWEKTLKAVVETIKPENAWEELDGFREQFGDDPDTVAVALGGFMAEFFVESAGLFAATGLPADEALTALTEIETTLQDLDFETGRHKLEREALEYYDALANFAQSIYPRLGTAMRILFTTYITGDYDPDADPDLLIEKGVLLGDEDETKSQGQGLIAQAGAIALHGTFPWWRWPEEATGPLVPLLGDILLLAGDFTNRGRAPLGPISEARIQTRDIITRMEQKTTEEPKPGPSKEPSPVDQLIDEIIEQGEGPTPPEWAERARTLGDDAVWALIDLAGDEEFAPVDAPGEGYAPIHAVHLLGELQAADAVPTLIDLVYDADPLEIIYSAALHALQQIGAPALEPLLQCFRYSRDTEGTVALCEALEEIGKGDQRAYEALANLWDKVSWDQGRILIASALGKVGDPRALPLLREAQRDPTIDGFEEGDLDYAVERLIAQAGEDIDTTPYLLARLERELARAADIHSFHEFVDQVPSEWRSNGERTSHHYTDILEKRLLGLTLELVFRDQPAQSTQPLTQLISALDEMQFDADVRGTTLDVQAGYQHLAECAGPYLKRHCLGMWLAFLHYASGDYNLDLDPAPDEMLFPLRAETTLDDEARAIVGRAGALALRGQPLWSLWPGQMEKEIGAAIEAVLDLRQTLQKAKLFPLPDIDHLDQQFQEIHTIDLSLAPQRTPALKDLMEKLFETRPGADKPRGALLRQFQKRRANAIPELMRLVETRGYWRDDAPGEGWTPILAARLLGFLGAVKAADTLVDAVVDTDWKAIIHDAAILSLIALGQPALPAVRNYFRYGREDEGRVALAEVLGRTGQDDPESFELLADLWERVDWPQYKRLIAVAFGALGDTRAIPLLRTGMEDSQTDVFDRDYTAWALATLEEQPSPSATKLGRFGPNRPKLPQLPRPRLIADEQDRYALPSFTVWGELLCPDCGARLVQDISGLWTHPLGSSKGSTRTSRPKARTEPPRSPKKRRRKRKKRKRR